MFRALLKISLTFSLVLLLTGPVTFYEGGWLDLVHVEGFLFVIFILFFAFCLLVFRQINNVWSPTPDGLILASFAYVLTFYFFALLDSPGTLLSHVFGLLAYALIVGLLVGRGFMTTNFLNSRNRKIASGVICTSLCFALVAWLWPQWRWQSLWVLPIGVLGMAFAVLIGSWVRSWVVALNEVWAYARRMGPPIGGFALGYVVIAYAFAGIFAAVWRSEPKAFTGLPENPPFLDFFYYSVVTISTVGYGDVTAKSSAAKVFVCLEILVGLAWTVVIFAAVIAVIQDHLQSSKMEIIHSKS